MVRSAKWALVILVACAMSMTIGCPKGKKAMSDTDFQKITGEWVAELLGVTMQKAFSGEKVNDKDMEKLAYSTLEKVCQKYGYTRAQFEQAAKKMGKDLEGVMKEKMEGQGWQEQ